MAEVIDLMKHPLWNKRNRSQATDWPSVPLDETQNRSLEEIEENDFIAVSIMHTDDLVGELLSHLSKGSGMRQIPKKLIIMELATRLESYSEILEEAINRIDPVE